MGIKPLHGGYSEMVSQKIVALLVSVQLRLVTPELQCLFKYTV